MIAHHPSDLTLARLAGGSLGAGPQLVVATHLSACPQCRERLQSFEAVGGAMLDGTPPARLSADAFARALKRVDEADQAAEPAPRVLHPDLPPPLNGYEMGPCRGTGCPAATFSMMTLASGASGSVSRLQRNPRPTGRHGPIS